jgi:uncharacterized membrane protein
MPLLQDNATAWDLAKVLGEPAFRIAAILIASFAGYGLALYIRSRINRRKLTGQSKSGG